MSDLVLRVEGITKRFANIRALRDVSMTVEAGRVTCLLGDNGAGKSTLIQILAGVHLPTAGRYLIDGVPVAFASPRDALAHGIATVYQDLALIPLLSVWRNFFLGAEPSRGWGPFRRLDVERCVRVTREELARLGVEVRDPAQPVATMSGGERQAVAIARAIHLGGRVLVLDEPTAALGVRQAEVVLSYVARARERGIAVVLVTHNPHHAVAVGDRFVVLRHGEIAADRARGEVEVGELMELMGG
jgi:simple sugar transport system ATP-binding protein